MARLIWQYWETRGRKPAFVDGLHRLAQRNSGCEVILVTPENLREFLPDFPPELLEIKVLAHKADMIRTMLIARHGGMWLDSDAVVLRDLNPIFDHLDRYDFVGYSAGGSPGAPVKVNCFASRPAGTIVSEWSRLQQAKFPRTEFSWTEIGSDILTPLCRDHAAIVKLLPFEDISPVSWKDVEAFGVSRGDRRIASENLSMVMLSNEALKSKVPVLQMMTCQDIAESDLSLAEVMQQAIGGEPVDARSSRSLGARLQRAMLRLRTSAGRIKKRLLNRRG